MPFIAIALFISLCLGGGVAAASTPQAHAAFEQAAAATAQVQAAFVGH